MCIPTMLQPKNGHVLLPSHRNVNANSGSSHFSRGHENRPGKHAYGMQRSKSAFSATLSRLDYRIKWVNLTTRLKCRY